MKKLLLIPAVTLMFGACGSTHNPKKIATQNVLKSITLTVDSTMVNPTVFKSASVTVLKSDLTLTSHGKTKKLTQAQYNNIISSIKGVDLSKLKSKKRPMPLLGSSYKSVVIQKGQKSYTFVDNSSEKFPKEIDALVKKLRKY